ncbi:hypothetical protein C7271_23825, partial [filamentous cyanobacterium CCP5]
MLTLPFQTHGDIILARDDNTPDLYYATAARPRLAYDREGRPRLKLIRWVAPDSGGTQTTVGARLSLDVDLRPSAADLRAAGFDSTTVQPFPWSAAQIQLEAPEMEPVVAEVFVAVDAPSGLSIDVPPTTASLLMALLQRETTSPLQITWIGTITTRLPAARVVATADKKEIQRRLETTQGHHHRQVLRSLTAANARIALEGVADPELETALREWAISQLTDRLEQDKPLLVEATVADVVPWPVRLPGTLDSHITPVHRQNLVQEIVLDADDVSRSMPVTIRVLGDFSNGLERVDVQIQPALDGELIELTLRDDQSSSVSLGADAFRWRYRPKLKAHSVGDWSTWREDKPGHSLVLPVATPTQLRLEVISAGLDFERRWQLVQVTIIHTLPDQAPISHVVELHTHQRSQIWTQPLKGVRGTVRAEITCLSRQGLSVNTTLESVDTHQIVITDPLAANDRLITLVPKGSGWADIHLVMVDVRYCDGDYCFEETLELPDLSSLRQWHVPVRQGGPLTVNWRYHVSFADGRFQQSLWHSTEESVILISLEGPPQRNVQILPVYFDPAQTSHLEVNLSQTEQTKTAVFT